MADAKHPKLLHRLKGHRKPIYAVGFTPDSGLTITGSYDETLRLWRLADGKMIKLMSGHKAKIQALAVNPKDGTIASGDRSGEIRLWDGTSGAFMRIIANQGTTVGALVFSPDGTRLLSTCGQGHPCHDHVWNVTSGKELATHKIDDNIVLAAAISPDGRFAATGGGDNQEIHVWELANGRRVKNNDGNPLSLMGTGAAVWAAGFSQDSQNIAWGNKWTQSSPVNRGPLDYQLRLPGGLTSGTASAGAVLGQPQLVEKPKASNRVKHTSFARAKIRYGAYSLSHRLGRVNTRPEAVLEIKKDGRVIKSILRGSTDGYRHRAYSFTPDGKMIISGGSGGVLEAYGLDGKRLHAFNDGFVGHEGDIWAVTPSPDGRYLISGSDDQTVRLWNLKTRELIVTLFRGADASGKSQWVMWTEQGFYTGSEGAGDIVGWQINKGPSKAAGYITGGQFRKILRRPDIISDAIRLASAKAAVKKHFPEKGFDLARLLASPPPEIRLSSGALLRGLYGGSTEMRVLVKPGPVRLGSIEFYVNDGKVDAQPVPTSDDVAAPPDGWDYHSFRVPLGEGGNNISIIATNKVGASQPAKALMLHRGRGLLDKDGTLRILAIGVDKYPGLGKSCPERKNNECHLNFAGADARLFAKTLTSEMTRQHKAVTVQLLTNGSKKADRPTRANILKALNDLAAASKQEDTIAVFIAGHGETGPNGRYHFLPTDIAGRAMDDKGTGRNIIKWDNIQSRFTAANGRRLLFVDACQAGAGNAQKAYNSGLSEDARIEKFVAFAAAGPGQLAAEHPDQGHGLFTFALAAGLKGGAMDTERTVRVYGLSAYLSAQVRKMSNGQQTPEVQSGLGDAVLVRR